MARISSLKSLNAFPHAEEHLLKKTYSGAVVTILGLLIMITLVMHELQFYLTTYTVHQCLELIQVRHRLHLSHSKDPESGTNTSTPTTPSHH